MPLHTQFRVSDVPRQPDSDGPEVHPLRCSHTEIVWLRADPSIWAQRADPQRILQLDLLPSVHCGATAMDDHQKLLSSVARCYMRWLLAIAACQEFSVDAYHDSPVGTLRRNSDGRWQLAHIILRPRVEFGGARIPRGAHLSALHRDAYRKAILGNSIGARVVCEPVGLDSVLDPYNCLTGTAGAAALACGK